MWVSGELGITQETYECANERSAVALWTPKRASCLIPASPRTRSIADALPPSMASLGALLELLDEYVLEPRIHQPGRRRGIL